MAEEIEYKYLVVNEDYIPMSKGCVYIRQGYLSRDPDRVVRIRVTGDMGFITVKSRNHGAARLEFEYAVPKKDAEEMLRICQPPVIEKMRYLVDFGGFTWEVDRFLSPCDYTVAEIEVPEAGVAYALPPFVGENVTGRKEYYNSNI